MRKNRQKIIRKEERMIKNKLIASFLLFSMLVYPAIAEVNLDDVTTPKDIFFVSGQQIFQKIK